MKLTNTTVWISLDIGEGMTTRIAFANMITSKCTLGKEEYCGLH